MTDPRRRDAGGPAGPAMSEPLTAEEEAALRADLADERPDALAPEERHLMRRVLATLDAARPSGEVDARSFTRWFLSQPYERRQAFLRENGAARPSGEDANLEGYWEKRYWEVVPKLQAALAEALDGRPEEGT